MSENELKKDFDINENKFRLVCKRYGLDYKKAIYYTNIIVVPGRKNDVYVTFDKKCNVIDVRKYNGKFEDMNKYFESMYNAFNDDELSGISICDEYNTMNSKISLGTIFRLTDKYITDNNGVSTTLDLNDNLSKEQKDLISFFSFLKIVGDKYNLIRYQMLSYGFDFPDFNTYVKKFVYDLNNYINECINKNLDPDANEFIDLSGQINMILIYHINIRNAINLLLKSKGYEISDNGELVEVYCIALDDVINSIRDNLEGYIDKNKSYKKI